MNNIILTPDAASDLASCYTYIAERNPDAARHFSRATEESFASLAEMPGIGTSYEVKNLLLNGLRRSLVRGFKNHQIFYLSVEGGITIIRVLHGARDIRTIMGYAA